MFSRRQWHTDSQKSNWRKLSNSTRTPYNTTDLNSLSNV